jgi:hypothetical protein
MLKSGQPGDAVLYLGFLEPPGHEAVQTVKLMADAPEWIRLPDTGKSSEWQMRITTGALGKVQVCGDGPFQVQERTT